MPNNNLPKRFLQLAGLTLVSPVLLVGAIGVGVYRAGKAASDLMGKQLTDIENNMESAQEKYANRVGFGKDVTLDSVAFKTLADKKASDFNVFSTIKLEGRPDIDIRAKLSADTSAEATTLKDDIVTCLAPSPEFTKAKDTFEKDAKHFTEIARKGVPIPFATVNNILGSYYTAKSDAIIAIKAQHAAETTRLTQFLENPDKQIQLTAKLAGTASLLPTVKKSMRDDLEKSQKAELSAFEKSTSETLIIAHKAATEEMDKLIFSEVLRNTGSSRHTFWGMKKRMAQLDADLDRQRLEERARANEPNVVRVGENNDVDATISIQGIDPKKIGDIFTNSRKTIRADFDQKTNKASYHLDLHSVVRDPTYFLGETFGKKNIDSDLLLMALAQKANGDSNIDMAIDTRNPTNDPYKTDKGKALARRAFAACIKAGYPPENITITIDGKRLKYQLSEEDKKNTNIKPNEVLIHDALFAGHGNEYRAILSKSKSIAEKKSKSFKSGDDELKKHTESSEFKAAYKKLKPPVVPENPPVAEAQANAAAPAA
ncbi:MAG: hypothetical protein H0U75_05655 [Legionella sp.]|nr:hypothetical protein [Legionella sp.]